MHHRTFFFAACLGLLPGCTAVLGDFRAGEAPPSGELAEASGAAATTSAPEADASAPGDPPPDPPLDASPPPAPDAADAFEAAAATLPPDVGASAAAQADASPEAAPVCTVDPDSVQISVPYHGVVYGTEDVPTACTCSPDCACLLSQPVCASGTALPTGCNPGQSGTVMVLALSCAD
jgi:hypothetical protein